MSSYMGERVEVQIGLWGAKCTSEHYFGEQDMNSTYVWQIKVYNINIWIVAIRLIHTNIHCATDKRVRRL